MPLAYGDCTPDMQVAGGGIRSCAAILDEAFGRK